VLFFLVRTHPELRTLSNWGVLNRGLGDFAKVSTSPRLARAVAIASACLPSDRLAHHEPPRARVQLELSGAHTGRSMASVIVSTVPSLHDSTWLVGRKGTAIRRQPMTGCGILRACAPTNSSPRRARHGHNRVPWARPLSLASNFRRADPPSRRLALPGTSRKGTTYMKIVLQNTTISSHSSKPVETVSFICTETTCEMSRASPSITVRRAARR
jgi:hypothetical protein